MKTIRWISTLAAAIASFIAAATVIAGLRHFLLSGFGNPEVVAKYWHDSIVRCSLASILATNAVIVLWTTHLRTDHTASPRVRQIIVRGLSVIVSLFVISLTLVAINRQMRMRTVIALEISSSTDRGIQEMEMSGMIHTSGIAGLILLPSLWMLSLLLPIGANRGR